MAHWLFLALNVILRFDDAEVRVAFETITEDPGSAVLSAVVLSDDFSARCFNVGPNPRASRPLSEGAQKEIARVLDLGLERGPVPDVTRRSRGLSRPRVVPQWYAKLDAPLIVSVSC